MTFKPSLLGLLILCTPAVQAQPAPAPPPPADPSQDPMVQKGVADWQNSHAPYLDELRGLSGSQEPGAQGQFLKLRGELMRSVAGPLFQSAGLEMPAADDPMAAQLMLQRLLSQVGQATQGPGGLMPSPAGGGAAGGSPSPAGMDLGALQKLLGGGASTMNPPAAPGSLQFQGADGILRKIKDDQEMLLELE